MGRIIFHSDMNSCFANIECLYDPTLRGKPVSVCGSVEERHGIVLASTQEAKLCGVRTGDAVWEAKRKCPELITVPPHYDRYLKFSRLSREIYSEYTDRVEPFGLDEAFLDVTGCLGVRGTGEKLADEIRARMKAELGLTVSIGVADNKVFAKLGSDLKKPDAVTVIPRERYREVVWPLPVGALLFVGRSTGQKLYRCGIRTIGALASCDERLLFSMLGRMGQTLHAFANGMDTEPVARAGDEAAVKSISNGTTPPRDIRTPEDAGIIYAMLADSMAARLRAHGLAAGMVQVGLRDTNLNRFQRQMKLPRPTCLSSELRRAAMALTEQSWSFAKPLRSVTLYAGGLSSGSDPVQLSMFEDDAGIRKQEAVERALDDIRGKFGRRCICRAVTLLDPTLGRGGMHGAEPSQPGGFFRGAV